MLNLLKQKTKVTIASKERKKFDAFIPEKRLKPNPPPTQMMDQPTGIVAPTSQPQMRKAKITPTLLETFNKKD